MTVKSLIRSRIVAHALSEKKRQRSHVHHEKILSRSNAPRVVEYYHDAADPYAHLTLQVLTELQTRYDIELACHLISGPPANATPERAALGLYARKDAQVLADHVGLDLPDPLVVPSSSRLEQANAQLAAALDSADFAARATAISTALWSGQELPQVPQNDPQSAMAEGDAKLAQGGHYLGATFIYGKECYWGLDRLHFLERRLQTIGATRSKLSAKPLFDPPKLLANTAPRPGLTLELYASFRSPYAYIAFDQARMLAEAYGAKFVFYAILPMVTRGLAVPPQKKIYIMRDAAREAQRLGIPFGRIVDPLGNGVSRGQSILTYARKMGRYDDYASSFFKGVWADGLDAASDRGLSRIVSRAGLNWSEAKSYISDDSWRAEAEENRKKLISLGLWGAPTFRVGDTVTWGQDRLWVVENALRAAAAA